MTRTLLMFACLGLMVGALGCRSSSHGVCDCDAPPAAYGPYGVYGHDAHHGGPGHIDPVPVDPAPADPAPVDPGHEPGN
jgi:hypothetical protein